MTARCRAFVVAEDEAGRSVTKACEPLAVDGGERGRLCCRPGQLDPGQQRPVILEQLPERGRRGHWLALSGLSPGVVVTPMRRPSGLRSRVTSPGPTARAGGRRV